MTRSREVSVSPCDQACRRMTRSLVGKMSAGLPNRKDKGESAPLKVPICRRILEAAIGVEPMMEVLQTSASGAGR